MGRVRGGGRVGGWAVGGGEDQRGIDCRGQP